MRYDKLVIKGQLIDGRYRKNSSLLIKKEMSMLNKKSLGLLLAISITFTNSAFAQATAEQAIHYRQSAFEVLLWNWMPMSAMVRGKVPYDKAKFALHAGRVAAISTQLLEGFPKGSDKGAKTEAKPEIWVKFADFQSKMTALQNESAALSKLAAAGDLNAIKTQFAKVGGACKACHDNYKSE
jgi:cytochrome c556